MEISLDSNQKRLLARLGEILQDPALPMLLQQMDSQESLRVPEEPRQLSMNPLSNQINPQKASMSTSSKGLKRRLSHSETTSPRKRARSPLSLVSSKRTLMSRLLNHRKTPPSTPILQKSSPLSLPETVYRKPVPLTTIPLLAQLTSPPNQVGTNITPEPIENQMNLTRTVRATSQPKNPNSSNQICHGTSHPMDQPLDLATPCAETCRLLQSYNLDISKAKFFVKIAPRSPSGIPSSQWEHILKGDAVDLNQVFSSLHHVVADEERTGRLGEAEITFGVTEPKRRISTAAEWSAAWRKASKAIAFAFPHRREKLLEYGDYLELEFAAKIASSHHKLLLYDTALRNEVAGGQHILLTDHSRFSRLYSAIVMPDGIEGSSDGTTPRKPSKNKGSDKPEICNKFNASTCKKSDAECKYRHLCKNCGKSGHGLKNCQDGSK